MRAAARRVARCVRDATAAAAGPAPQLRRLLAPESSPRSSRALVRWLASAVPPDGFARRGYGRGRGRGGDTRRADDARASNLHLRDVQRAIVDAPDVQTILDLCDPATVARFSSVNVATALSKMAKRAQRPATETRGFAPRRARLGEHPAFAALCDRAAQLISRDAFPHRAVCNSAHALAALQHRGHARVTAQFVGGGALDAPASAAWRALRGAMPSVDTVDDACVASKPEQWKGSARGRTDAYAHISDAPVSARQSTMFLYASALARDPPSAGVLRGIWRELRVAESRVGAHHVSNLVWALGTLGLDPGPEGWGIVDRRVPLAFRAEDPPGAFNAQNVANTWWGFAKLRRAPRGDGAAALSRATVAVSDAFKPQELANAMWARAHLASACGLRVEPSVRAAFDDAVARTLDAEKTRRRRAAGANGLGYDDVDALDDAGVKTALRFKSKELSQVFWHYASLSVKPRDALWRSLDAAAEAQAPFASPMDVSLTLWACATLGKPPSPRAWAAMERRTRALVAGGHVGSGPGTTATKGFAPSSSKTGDGDGDANRRARAGHVLVEWQQVANLVWSYAKLRTMPDAATLDAIRDAAARLALEKPTEMTPQDASMLLWGHVTLGTLVAPRSASGRASDADADASDAADQDRDRDRDRDPIGIPIPIPPCRRCSPRWSGTPTRSSQTS
jgi:hypothetical protein